MKPVIDFGAAVLVVLAGNVWGPYGGDSGGGRRRILSRNQIVLVTGFHFKESHDE